jgi:predicted ribosomally synthesized peptide with nif11-like leader
MSIESAKEFLEKMRADETYAQNVVEASSREQRATLVKGQGFEFNKEELEGAVSELGDDIAELGEEDLDQVAGGAARKGSGNKYFKSVLQSFRAPSIGSSSNAYGMKCDSSGSEGECVC